MILITADKSILMLLQKKRSRWYSLVCIGRRGHYRKDGTCKHVAELLDNIRPEVRDCVRVDPFGGKRPSRK